MKRKIALLSAVALCLSSVSCPDFTALSLSYAAESSDSNPVKDSESELPALKEGEARVVLRDYNSGELIKIENVSNPRLTTNIAYKDTVVQGGWIYSGPVYNITENPLYCNLAKYTDADLFEAELSGELYCYCLPDDSKEIIKNENGSMEIIFRLKAIRNGDVTADGVFSAQDIIEIQKWFLGDSDTVPENRMAADFNEDGKINIADFCMMKNELVNRTEQITIVSPEVESFGSPFIVNGDDLKLYSGPGREYPVAAFIPFKQILSEIGYNKGNNEWIYTEYNGQFGWIAVNDENGKRNVYYMATTDKPVIYLYPEEETDVHVELKLNHSTLATTYPKYSNGWDVTALPDGTLINKADGTRHKYLFWDACDDRTRYDFSKGFCVAGSDTESFLKEKLTYMGLTEQEMNEFIVYWLPLMEHNAYNLISFQDDEYTESAELTITPEPDSLCRIFMAYIPLDEEVETEPQQLETFERKGFTAVEWGGCAIKR